MTTISPLLELERQMAAEATVNAMFDRVDIMDDPTRKRLNVENIDEALDFDPDDDYNNELAESGVHPEYAAFDDPDSVDDDDDILWIE